jgi:hypothetical protein
MSKNSQNGRKKGRTFEGARLLDLLNLHGELMTSRDLAALFRFGSDRSFRRAAQTGALPVAIVKVPGRRGWFARTREVAAWLESLGGSADAR